MTQEELIEKQAKPNLNLVTVRREDLRNTLSLTYPYIDEDTSVEIDERLTAMEEAAR